MNPLTEIISKLEKATGPDRELDAEIWSAVFGPWRNGDEQMAGEPLYTSSIDSALTLVPEGWAVCGWVVFPSGVSELFLEKQNSGPYQAFESKQRPSAAIALCIASLKAIAALRSR